MKSFQTLAFNTIFFGLCTFLAFFFGVGWTIQDLQPLAISFFLVTGTKSPVFLPVRIFRISWETILSERGIGASTRTGMRVCAPHALACVCAREREKERESEFE